jgi:hypothetical protein
MPYAAPYSVLLHTDISVDHLTMISNLVLQIPWLIVLRLCSDSFNQLIANLQKFPTNRRGKFSNFVPGLQNERFELTIQTSLWKNNLLDTNDGRSTSCYL